MSANDIIIAQSWLQQILARTAHVLLHQTDRECALSILQSGRIHGRTCFDETNTEAYPHFLYEGWPLNRNNLSVRNEITLVFECDLPARYRGLGPDVPEPGFLEIYTVGTEPWQCCIHPESSPLSFIDAREWEGCTAWHDWFPLGQTLDARLNREVEKAKNEQRAISASIA